MEERPEIILDRTELLLLLDSLGADSLLGLETSTLIPTDRTIHEALVAEGAEHLEQREMLQRAPDGTLLIDPVVSQLGVVITRPDLGLISMRMVPGSGTQLAIHYVRDQRFVEQTLLDERTHRFLILPNGEALLERLATFFPVRDPAPDGMWVVAQELVQGEQGGGTERAMALVNSGMPVEQAHLLVDSLANPVFQGSIVLLRCRNGEIIDARNLAIVQGTGSAWSLAQVLPGQTPLRVTRVGPLDLVQLITSLYNELQAR